MAGIIPEGQRKRLQSAQVGTAGVDLSTARALSSVAGAVKSIGAKQAKAEAKQSALRKQALTDSRTAIRGSKFATTVSGIRSASKDPEDFNTKVGEFLEAQVGGIEDDAERAAFSRFASNHVLNQSLKTNKHFKDRELGEIENNLNINAETNATFLNDTFSLVGPSLTDIPLSSAIEDFDEINKLYEEQLDTFTQALGSQRVQEIKQDGRARNARGAINALIDSSPESVNEFIDRAVRDTLPPDEVQALREYATKVKKSRDKAAETFNRREKDTTATDFSRRTSDGDAPTEDEINQAILEDRLDPTEAKAIRALKSSSKRVFLGDNPATFNELSTMYSAITISPTATEEDDDQEGATFSQLAAFRQRTMEAMENGTISMADGSRWLKAIAPKFNETTGELFKEINKKTVPGKHWGTNVEIVIKDPNDRAEAIMNLQREMLDRIDREEEVKGSRLSMNEVRDIRQDITLDAVLLRGSDLFVREEGEIITFPDGSKAKVTGFKDDGEAIINDDLNAPIKKDSPFTKDKKRK